MADMNAMTRVVGKLRVPCIVIDKETGERLHRHAIDAKEMVGDGKGRYEWATDVAGVPVTEVKVDAHGNPIALVNVVVPDEPATTVVVEPELEPEIEDADPAADAPPAAAPKTTKGAKGAKKAAKK